MVLTRDEICAISQALTWCAEIPFSVVPKPPCTSHEIEAMHRMHEELSECIKTIEPSKELVSLEAPIKTSIELRICYLSLSVLISELGYNDAECLMISRLTVQQCVELLRKIRTSILASLNSE